MTAAALPGRDHDAVTDAEIVPFPTAGSAEAELVAALTDEDRDWLAEHGWRGTVARFNDTHRIMRPREIAASASWWSRYGGMALVKFLLALPLVLARELRPILRGVGRVAVGWARWMSAVEYAEAAKAAEGNERAKHGERLERARSGRRKLSAAAAVILLIGVWVLVTWWPMVGVGGGLLAVAAFDAVGRSGREGPPAVTVLPPGPIAEGIPLSSLRAQIEQSLVMQGFDPADVAVEMPRPADPDGWTMRYYCRHQLEDDHLRAIERDLQVRRGAVSLIADKGNAARGELTLMLRDPLARVVESPNPGPLSINQPLPLGVVASGVEWREHFLRVHFTVIGASQSGKSSCLWQITDVLRRCPEVELDAIDLTEGPAFGASRRAFRKRAFDEDGAKRILTEAVALCKERNAELQRLAEDDDTPDDYEEKHQPTVERPQRVVLIDEFARVAENDELLKLVEYILRYGAKAAVVVGIAGQGATLQDFGTSVVRAQVMLKILFACARRDVLDLFGKDARDAGYRPDLFEPANGAGIQDAGKCYVMSATSRTPEPRRAYRLEQAEVRRRDRELGRREQPDTGTVEGAVVPALLVKVGECFAHHGDPEILPTADLLAWLGEGWTGKRLASELREWLTPGQHTRTKVRGYFLADYQKAVEDL